jgi:hypothetical protein
LLAGRRAAVLEPGRGAHVQVVHGRAEQPRVRNKAQAQLLFVHGESDMGLQRRERDEHDAADGFAAPLEPAQSRAGQRVHADQCIVAAEQHERVTFLDAVNGDVEEGALVLTRGRGHPDQEKERQQPRKPAGH